MSAPTLRKLLLSYNGREVLGLDSKPPKPNFDLPGVYIAPLLRIGRLRQGEAIRIRKRGMEPCRCFDNAERLVQEGKEPVYAIGFAFTESDGFWRPHGWCISKRNTIVETTTPREMYFGIEIPADVVRKAAA